MTNFINKLKDVICYRIINEKTYLTAIDRVAKHWRYASASSDAAKDILKFNARRQTLDGFEVYVIDKYYFDMALHELDLANKHNDKLLSALTFMRGL